MELPGIGDQIGKQCEVETCQQLDFLPIQCAKCEKTFCKNHSSLDSHNCSSLNQAQTLPNKSEPKKEFLKPCCLDKCQKSVVTNCPICALDFCMDHRLEKDHSCSKVYENHIEDSLPKTQALVESILAKRKELPKSDPKTVKNQKLAAKVQLMKLKMKAVGPKSIPTQDRIYFGIKNPKFKDPKPVFVNQIWPFGKVIDAIADQVGLENKNNVANAPKLKLFKHLDGFAVTDQLETSLKDLLKVEEIFNGDILIMDYVESNDVMQIQVSK